MDDFERGAREMQRVAAEAIEQLALGSEEAMRACSKGLDHGVAWSRLQAARDHYRAAVLVIRAIKIQDTVSG